MSINTETKRRSVAGMLIAALVIAPVPDNVIAAVDREHIIGIYAGIAPTSPGVATDHIHILATGKVEPNHASDSGNNLLLAGQLEAQSGGYFGGPANYIEQTSGGDLIFHGGAGLSYGNCYGDHINWTQGSAAQNTWYKIDDDTMTDNGNLHNITHDGRGLLTVSKAGRYWVMCSITWVVNKLNNHVDVGIEVDGVSVAVESHAHTSSKFIGEEHLVAVNCILDLAAGAKIQAAIRTLDAVANTDFIVDDVNFSCVQIGGT